MFPISRSCYRQDANIKLAASERQCRSFSFISPLMHTYELQMRLE